MDTEYNYFLVSLSYIISVMGSFTALKLAVHIPTASPQSLWSWVASSSVALGGGAIWAMHFIAMLAYKTSMEITYDPILTITSLVLAVIVVAIGLLVVGRGELTLLKLILSGLVAGLGVCGMHYTGMAAMNMPADINYNVAIVSLSVVIAIVAATVAFWLAFNLRGNIQRFGSALVMGSAVCGMHYTGMAAVTLTANPNKSLGVNNYGFTPEALGLYIFGSVSLLLTVFLITSLFKKEQIEEEENEDEFLFD